MRAKSESRRRGILDAAAEVFRSRGFDAASMSEIAARIGGSKATLYNYFESKEQLFAIVMVEQVRAHADPLVEALEQAPDLKGMLRTLAPAYLRVMLHPDTVAINRMCAAEGERCGFGPAVYEAGPKRAWERIAARLSTAMGNGELRQEDPWRTAMHLKALVEADLVEARVRGWRAPPSDPEIDAAAAAAVEAFLRAYAP